MPKLAVLLTCFHTTTFLQNLVLSRFSRQNDAGLRALTCTVQWENLVLAVVLVLEPKALDCFHSRDENRSNRCYAAILVYQKPNQTKALSVRRMVMCTIVGCASKSGQDKGVYFARVLSIVTNQGKKAQKFSRHRRSRWILAKNRDDLTNNILENDWMCGRHFVSGRAAKTWDRYILSGILPIDIFLVQFPRKK